MFGLTYLREVNKIDGKISEEIMINAGDTAWIPTVL